MALDCTAQTLSVNSAKLVGSLSHKELLAALVYIQCTANHMDCTSETLLAQSKCLVGCMTEKQLLAALLYIQCSTGGGGGGGTGSVLSGVGQPVADPGVANAVYTDTTTGNNFWFYNGSWH